MDGKPTDVDAVQAVEDQYRQADDVGVHGRREQPTRLLRAAQVGEHDEQQRDETELDAIRTQDRERRRDGGDARGHRHRDREYVVDQQRRTGHQRCVGSEVLAAHHVRATTARVRVDRLPIAGDHDQQQDGDHDRDRHQVVERRQTRNRDEHEQDLFGRRTPSTRWRRTRRR